MRRLLLVVLALMTVVTLQVGTPAASAGPALLAAAGLCTPDGCQICNNNNLKCSNIEGNCYCV